MGPSEKGRAPAGVWDRGVKSSHRMGAEDGGGARVEDSSRHWGLHTEPWDGHSAF